MTSVGLLAICGELQSNLHHLEWSIVSQQYAHIILIQWDNISTQLEHMMKISSNSQNTKLLFCCFTYCFFFSSLNRFSMWAFAIWPSLGPSSHRGKPTRQKLMISCSSCKWLICVCVFINRHTQSTTSKGKYCLFDEIQYPSSLRKYWSLARFSEKKNQENLIFVGISHSEF